MNRFGAFGRILFTLAIVIVAVYLFPYPWKMGSITVTGEAKLETAPQIATFNASVSVSDDLKDTAVNSVNKKMNDLITAVKAFGISDQDIKTQNVSISENQSDQIEIMIYPPRDKTFKRWTATNSIEIKLKDTSKASALTDLLNESGATSVYGPNFAIDNTDSFEDELLTKAIADAKTKAEKMAKAGGRSLGKMTSVSEFGVSAPVRYALEAKGGDTSSAPIEPGTETLYKTVTATFELR